MKSGEGMSHVWQRVWDSGVTGRHLYSIQQTVERRITPSGVDRRAGFELARMRLAHCGLGAGLMLMGKHQDGLCTGCGMLETVPHILLQCKRYQKERGILFCSLADIDVTTFSLRTLLGPAVDVLEVQTLVLEFLHTTGMFNRV